MKVLDDPQSEGKNAERLARLGLAEPLGYVEGTNLYEFVMDDPVGLLDPVGLQSTKPKSAPTTMPTAHSGSGAWGSGDHQVSYAWSMQDVSGDANHQAAMGTGGHTIFTLIKVKKGSGKCPCTGFRWIQYSEARFNGKVYTPPGGYPWTGIDRWPGNGGRTDPDPYVFLNQGAVDGGNAYGGNINDLYDPKGADSVFVDWASAGDRKNWSHYSVVVLICQQGGKDYRLGGLMYEWSVDGKGNLTYGARAASGADIDAWRAGLKAGFPKYSGGGSPP